MSDFNTNILIPPDYTTPIVSLAPTATLTTRQWNLIFFRVREFTYSYSGSFAVSGVVRSATSSTSLTLTEGLSDELELIDIGHFGIARSNEVNYLYDDASTSVDSSGIVWGQEYNLSGLDLSILALFNLISPSGFACGTVNIQYPIAWTGTAYNTLQGACSASVNVLNANGTGKDLTGSFSLTIVPSLFWGWGGKFDTVTGAPIP